MKKRERERERRKRIYEKEGKNISLQVVGKKVVGREGVERKRVTPKLLRTMVRYSLEGTKGKGCLFLLPTPGCPSSRFAENVRRWSPSFFSSSCDLHLLPPPALYGRSFSVLRRSPPRFVRPDIFFEGFCVAVRTMEAVGGGGGVTGGRGRERKKGGRKSGASRETVKRASRALLSSPTTPTTIRGGGGRDSSSYDDLFLR